MIVRTRLGAALAAIIASLATIALAIEFRLSIKGSLAIGLGLPEALFLYFRYFTILTDLGIALLMSLTFVRIIRGLSLPSSRLYAFALVYILVVCVTYEAMLRSTWSPQGIQFYSDMTMHDIVPLLSLIFWLRFAPKQGMRWRDAALLLIYPSLYFIVTLVAGALGESYPYDFLDVDRFGYPAVLRIAAMFLAIFYTLGVCVTAVARSIAKAADPST